MAGCDYAMHLDMNPYHTGFIFMAVDEMAGNMYKSQLLTSAVMSIPADRASHPVRARRTSFTSSYTTPRRPRSTAARPFARMTAPSHRLDGCRESGRRRSTVPRERGEAHGCGRGRSSDVASACGARDAPAAAPFGSSGATSPAGSSWRLGSAWRTSGGRWVSRRTDGWPLRCAAGRTPECSSSDQKDRWRSRERMTPPPSAPTTI